MEKSDFMKEALFSLIRDIHHSLDQTNIYSIHSHRPYFVDGKGAMKFTNMGENNQLAKDRINKLISDCGKIMDRVFACIDKDKAFEILNQNKDTIAVLHDLENYSKHIKKEKDPKGNFKPSIGEPEICTQFVAMSGNHAGIIHGKKTAFWDIGDNGSASIIIDADILKEDGTSYKKLVSLVKESLKIWEEELKKNNIEISEYIEPDPLQEAAKYGQHGSLFVESYDDALAKASILTSEKRFLDAVVLYKYALTKCKNDEQRAHCYACMALSYEDAGEFSMAWASSMTALKYNQYMRGLNVNFGRMCKIAGDQNNARIGFENELKLPDGDYVNAHINLSELKKDQGDSEGAIAHIKSALEIDPHSKIVNDMYAEYMKASA